MTIPKPLILCCCLACLSCHQPATPSASATPGHRYGYDATFLKRQTRNVVELHDRSNREKVLLSADFEGRVMTSTAAGDTGSSYGWINYDLIKSGEKKPHFNPAGGEERFWIGPEGGQYSVYFRGGDSFNLAHWQVPGVVDTEAYRITRYSDTDAVFETNATLTNYSGTTFRIAIRRSVSLLDRSALAERLHADIPPGVSCVGYESRNRIMNTGAEDWHRSSGLLPIWLLGMMTPTSSTRVMIPFLPVPGADTLITRNYFGDIPPSRLQVKDSVLYFVCDGRYRSKIGLSPLIAKSVAASFDFDRNVLTVILFPVDRKGRYVNSKWEWQRDPYRGDVVNAYNDGPLPDGSQLGPFYEVESSSPVEELKRGEAENYVQTTCHFEGDYPSLRMLVKKCWGLDLDDVRK